MFVHRVRDSDAAIRQDCLKELGVWVRTYSEKFMTGAFLVYFSRGCNDPVRCSGAEMSSISLKLAGHSTSA